MAVSSELFKTALNRFSSFSAQLVLYFPFGFFLPLADMYDAVCYYLQLHHLPKRYHDLQGVPHSHRNVRNALVEAHSECIKFFESIFSDVWFLLLHVYYYLMPTFLHEWTYMQSPHAERVKDWLLNHPSKTVYMGIIPLLFCGALWSVGGFPLLIESYLFLACSYWSGLMINTLTNLIILRQEAEEWQNMKVFFNKLRHGQDGEKWPLIKIFLINVLFRMLVDLTFFGYLNRHRDLIAGSFSYFFTWTGIYFATKAISNTTPDLLLSLESKLSDNNLDQEDVTLSGKCVWLVGYHALHSLGAQSAIDYYDQKHQASSDLSLLETGQSVPSIIDASKGHTVSKIGL